MKRKPLTLTLSPHAGRGDTTREFPLPRVGGEDEGEGAEVRL